jgi:hypothetical protein
MADRGSVQPLHGLPAEPQPLLCRRPPGGRMVTYELAFSKIISEFFLWRYEQEAKFVTVANRGTSVVDRHHFDPIRIRILSQVLYVHVGKSELKFFLLLFTAVPSSPVISSRSIISSQHLKSFDGALLGCY